MRDRASGVHPDVLEHLPPKKTGVCLLYCFVLSPLISLGDGPHHHLALSVKELTYSSIYMTPDADIKARIAWWMDKSKCIVDKLPANIAAN